MFTIIKLITICRPLTLRKEINKEVCKGKVNFKYSMAIACKYYNNFIAKQETLTGSANYNK